MKPKKTTHKLCLYVICTCRNALWLLRPTLAEKAAGSFFPSTATYIEQRFKNEDGSVSKQFNIAVFMPVTLGDGTLSIEVDNLVVTGATLGGIACSAGN